MTINLDQRKKAATIKFKSIESAEAAAASAQAHAQ